MRLGRRRGCALHGQCWTPDCSREALFKCPVCYDKGLPPSWFCGQDCFKANWKVHKKLHQKSVLTEVPVPYRSYFFTGDLRPAHISPPRPVPDSIVKPDYAVTGIPVSEEAARTDSDSIPVIQGDQVEDLRYVACLAREVLDEAGKAIAPGVTGDKIDEVVHNACMERECYPSPLNYYGFPKSCCVSVNEVVCHGIPDFRPFEEGDIVNVDVTVYHRGLHADLNETFFVGKVDDKGRELVDCAYQALYKAIRACKPGMRYRDIGGIIEEYCDARGFAVVRTYTGHGIGTLFHCVPNVPHYDGNRAVGVMQPGHVFTIEPMINEHGHDDVLWPDDWTAVTVDGGRSAQFEETLLVTETGVEILTQRTHGSYSNPSGKKKKKKKKKKNTQGQHSEAGAAGEGAPGTDVSS